MFDELTKYKNNNHFFFKPTDNLREVCNAPTDKSGVYLIYALKNGKQFGQPRRNSWKTIMEYEKIEALDIYWYITHDEKHIDCPKVIENKILHKYLEIYGKIPRWNNEI